MRRMEREGKVFYASGTTSMVSDHAHYVRTCLALIAALNASEFSEERERGRRVLRYIEETRPRIFSGPLLIPTLQKTFHQVDLTTLWKPDDWEDDKARVLLREFLAPNLGMVERGYDPKTGRTVFKFKALLHLITGNSPIGLTGDACASVQSARRPFMLRMAVSGSAHHPTKSMKAAVHVAHANVPAEKKQREGKRQRDV